MVMSQTSQSQRDSRLPDQDGWSISDAILTAGPATDDDPPAGPAEVQYMIRLPAIAMADQVTAGLDRNAAAMTGCRWVRKSRHGLTDHAIAPSVREAMQSQGAPIRDEAAKPVARKTQARLGMEPMAEPLNYEMSHLNDPAAAEAIRRRDLPTWQMNSTSDDHADMTCHASTARSCVARPAGRAFPACVINALGGIPATIDRMVRTAAKTLALSVWRRLENRPTRVAAMATFVQRTGGGTDWSAPLCDFPLPIRFRWPEQITTPRGQDWWIPSTMPGA